MSEPKLLRRPAVMAMTGLKKSTIHLWASQGKFPLPIKIGASRASAWISCEVLAWIDARVREGRERRSAPTARGAI